MQSCRLCRYFEAQYDDEGSIEEVGYCHANPPVLYNGEWLSTKVEQSKPECRFYKET